ERLLDRRAEREARLRLDTEHGRFRLPAGVGTRSLLAVRGERGGRQDEGRGGVERRESPEYFSHTHRIPTPLPGVNPPGSRDLHRRGGSTAPGTSGWRPARRRRSRPLPRSPAAPGPPAAPGSPGASRPARRRGGPAAAAADGTGSPSPASPPRS